MTPKTLHLKNLKIQRFGNIQKFKDLGKLMMCHKMQVFFSASDLKNPLSMEILENTFFRFVHHVIYICHYYYHRLIT